jgi:hypothetical protein
MDNVQKHITCCSDNLSACLHIHVIVGPTIILIDNLITNNLTVTCTINYENNKQTSSADVAMGYGLDGRGWISGRRKQMFSSAWRPEQF